MDHPTMRIVLDGAPVNLAHDAVQALLDALSARATNAEAECAVLRAREVRTICVPRGCEADPRTRSRTGIRRARLQVGSKTWTMTSS
jgi:hypothetical protein